MRIRLLAIVFVGVLAGCASAPKPTATPMPSVAPTSPAVSTPSNIPAPTNSPSAAPVSFTTVTSPLQGWSVDIPDTWRLRAATTAWPPHTYPEAGAAYTDNMEPSVFLGGFPAFDVNAQELPSDQTPEEFVAFITAENEARGYQVVSEEAIVVDGVTGRLQRQAIGSEGIWEVLLVDGNTAYAIYWVDLEADMATNEDLFRTILGSLRFPN
jgi:hypothetical protein